MKIIKYGNPEVNQLWKKEVTCTGNGNPSHNPCLAVLEVSKDDLTYYGHGYTKPSAVIFRYPCCGCITDMDPQDWPPGSTTDLKTFSVQWAKTGTHPLARVDTGDR